jgi:hypothetical protein
MVSRWTNVPSLNLVRARLVSVDEAGSLSTTPFAFAFAFFGKGKGQGQVRHQ